MTDEEDKQTCACCCCCGCSCCSEAEPEDLATFLRGVADALEEAFGD